MNNQEEFVSKIIESIELGKCNSVFQVENRSHSVKCRIEYSTGHGVTVNGSLMLSGNAVVSAQYNGDKLDLGSSKNKLKEFIKVKIEERQSQMIDDAIRSI